MSVIGLDFGSHTSSIALWLEERDNKGTGAISVEVIADDLGSRTIPCCVAFRGDEVITGQSAISQQHKNPGSTFDDIRSFLFKDVGDTPEVVSVPVIDKDISVLELASHYFRNIHNQIKQQVGKVVRDCVIVVPDSVDEVMKKKISESAQSGGVRIKAFLNDTTSTLLAYGLDDASLPNSKTLVIDIGWSKTEISLFDISGGLFFPLATAKSNEVCGSLFVKLLADHCAKDFQRKSKVPCFDNSKSMLRLRRECENAMKSLSSGAEGTIDIDSLCEGIDYSSKISRARFEDLLSIPFIHLKNLVTTTLKQVDLDANLVNQVCLAGGPSAMPKIVSTLKAVLPNASFLKGKFESFETQSIGAALHGKYLYELGLLDNAPTQSPIVTCLTRSLLLGTSFDGNSVTIAPANTVIPTEISLPGQVADSAGYLSLSFAPNIASDPPTLLGELNFVVDVNENLASIDVLIKLSISTTGEINVEVLQSITQVVLANLVIPAK